MIQATSQSPPTTGSAGVGSSKPRVFVAERNARYGLDDAKRFGGVVYLSDSLLQPFNMIETVQVLDAALTANGFNPALDFVCLTGGVPIVGLLMAVVSQRGKSLRCLMYDASLPGYRERAYAAPVAPAPATEVPIG